jgi:predicted nucleic acid-binding Zn ribbon protein
VERRERPRRLEDIVGALINRWDKGKKKKGDLVTAAWIGSVSEKTLGHARPISFTRGVLMIIVENSTWLYQLTMQKREIIKKFNNEYKGRQKLNDIRFRVGKIDV